MIISGRYRSGRIGACRFIVAELLRPFLLLLFFGSPARSNDKEKKPRSNLFNRFGAFDLLWAGLRLHGSVSA